MGNKSAIVSVCREVWPENDSFGHAGMSPEEEFMALREIYFAELGVGEYTSSFHSTFPFIYRIHSCGIIEMKQSKADFASLSIKPRRSQK